MAEAPTRRIVDYGDAALLVTFAEGDRDGLWAATQSLGSAVREARPDGLVDVVATFTHVFVSFDPVVTDRAALRALVDGLDAGTALAPPREHEIPLVYGGDDGPDLEEAAHELGLSPAELADLHRAGDWVIRFLAAPAGAPMMDGPRYPSPVARRPEPRLRVPAGSVGISGHQTIIYPVEAPGGWRIIGRTSKRLVDPAAEPMHTHSPGDRVRFVSA